jgi:hypothetical protein
VPLSFTIDRENRLVTTLGEGRVTFADAEAHQKGLLSHPDFDPTFDQLADLTRVTEFAVKTNEIEALAVRKIFAPGSRRVGIAPDDVQFGLLRMFEIYRDVFSGGEMTKVVRTREEALLWLHRQE